MERLTLWLESTKVLDREMFTEAAAAALSTDARSPLFTIGSKRWSTTRQHVSARGPSRCPLGVVLWGLERRDWLDRDCFPPVSKYPQCSAA